MRHDDIITAIQDDLEKCGLTHSYFTLPSHLPVFLMLMSEPRACIGHFFQRVRVVSCASVRVFQA